MVKYSKLIAPLVALFILGSSAIAAAVPIDTGYNYYDTSYPVLAPYPVPPPWTIRDNYWIAIASYPALVPAVQPAWVLKSVSPWAAPIAPNSRWIGPRNTLSSSPLVSTGDPGWTLFKKCFCLAPGFSKPTLSFRLMNDDAIQIYLNHQTNTLYGPAPTQYGTYSPTVTATPAQLSYLHAGRNCIYAYLEDIGGWTGFDLAGTFNAYGLYPDAAHYAAGDFPNLSFKCGCDHPGQSAVKASADDRQVVRALVRIAEARRRARKAR